MRTCKTCKYWEIYEDGYGKVWNECGNVDWVEKSDKISANGFAIYADAHDDSGLSCGVITGPDFACNHHKTDPVKFPFESIFIGKQTWLLQR